MLCFAVLAFIPINLLATPIVDFLTIQNRSANWTVTMSAIVFLVTLMPLFAVAFLLLRSRREKVFQWCMVIFFIYAFIFTVSVASTLFYPLYGLMSVLGSVLVAIVFYVAVRDDIISPGFVFSCLAFTSVFVLMPVLLVEIDPERFARLSQGVGTHNLLYGYENPRAVGWASTFFLSLIVAHLVTQPVEDSINPLLFLCMIIATATLFWSGSRGGVVAFVFSLCLVFSLSRSKNRKGFVSVLICIALGAAISLMLHLPTGSFGMFARISENLEEESISALSSSRTDLWQLTVSYILERPLIGYGYLPHKNLEGFTHGSAHNIILDAWLWFGLIIGTVVIMIGILFWIVTFRFFRKADTPHVAAMFCVITTLIVYSMLSGPYARTFPLILFAIPSGVILGLRSRMVIAQK